MMRYRGALACMGNAQQRFFVYLIQIGSCAHVLLQTVKMGVQCSLWGGSILNLGTEAHRRKYFEDIDPVPVAPKTLPEIAWVAHMRTGKRERGACEGHLVRAVRAAELLDGAVGRPGQLQRQVAPAPLVGHPAAQPACCHLQGLAGNCAGAGIGRSAEA